MEILVLKKYYFMFTPCSHNYYFLNLLNPAADIVILSAPSSGLRHCCFLVKVFLPRVLRSLS